MNRIAFVIGNGTSREDFDLNILKGHGTSYGCNVMYRESLNNSFPDYIVSIEPYRIEQIKEDKFPPDRCIFPPEEEQYEPLEYYKALGYGNVTQTPRSNAGMNALTESIRHGNKIIYLLGFDFLINGEQAVSNLYMGDSSTRCSYADGLKRVRYFDWFCRQNASVTFRVVFPADPPKQYHALEAINVQGMHYDKFKDMLYTIKLK